MLVIDMEKFISTPSGKKQPLFSVCASENLLSSRLFQKSVTIVSVSSSSDRVESI
jgi:hypothetical protein